MNGLFITQVERVYPMAVEISWDRPQAGGVRYMRDPGIPFSTAWIMGRAALIVLGVALVAGRHYPASLSYV
jgi:hypothetical protein